VLALKLLLVPSLLAAVTLASRRWGPRVGGWLAGLPLVTGPILLILALERGAEFASEAAVASLSAVAAAIAFGAAYAHACLRFGWAFALAAALSAWFAAAAALAALPGSVLPALGVALASLVAARYLFPGVAAGRALRPEPRFELPVRMLFAALLTLLATGVAERIGTGWTGLIAMFPVMSTLLAVFSHRAQGPAFAALILRGLATGLYALAAFCLVVAVALPRAGVAIAFAAAVAATALVQWATRPRITLVRAG
jgi:hypothetical protein